VFGGHIVITKNTEGVATGVLVGYRRSNPFSTKAKAFVKTDDKTIEIVMDNRQVVYFQKEYPVGSNVSLRLVDDAWQIESRVSTSDEFEVTRSVMPFNNVKA
jgi:hypothetical protein